MESYVTDKNYLDFFPNLCYITSFYPFCADRLHNTVAFEFFVTLILFSLLSFQIEICSEVRLFYKARKAVQVNA